MSSLREKAGQQAPPAPAQKLRAENRELQARVDELTEQLERERKKRAIKFSGVRAKARKGSFVRVTFGDTHGMRVEPAAFKAFVGDLEHLKPAEVIGMGDHLDCDGFLSSHKAIGYTSLSEYSYDEDVEAANAQFDAIDRACPEARKDYLEGNHEYRLRTWILDNSRNDRDQRFHEARYMPWAVLGLKHRGWEFRSRGEKHDGLNKRGTIRRGDCLFVHGDSHAQNAAKKHLDGVGMSVVFGHTHRHQALVRFLESMGVIGAWNPGCLCELHPMYGHSTPSDWSHGYGLQFVDRNRFHHVNIPIINGRSLLPTMLKALGAA